MLNGIRVVEDATGIAGAYCGKLLVDAGADVVRVSPVGDTPLDRYLARGKRNGAAGDADIYIADRAVDVDAPVVVTITPFGLDGPWADRPASELALQAAGGSCGWRGSPEGPPLPIGGRPTEWMAGLYGAVGALAALWGGGGRRVDVSMLEVVATTMVISPVVQADFMGWPPRTGPARTMQVPSVLPTADGWVTVTTNTQQQFADFLVLIERPDLLADEDLKVQQNRWVRRDWFLPIVHTWTTTRTTAEVVARCAEMRVPCGPVLDASTVRAFEQFVARDVFVDGLPRPPYRIHGELSEKPLPDRPRTNGLPLDGVRIVDLTMWWAGPSNPHLLAALGADVVKVESCTRPDPSRTINTRPPTEPQWWEFGPVFHGHNVNKRGVTLDLDDPRGIEALHRLLDDADVLVENFTPRVLDNFGLTWDALHERHQHLLVVRMPAFGLDGPWRDRGGFAQTMEAISGIAFRTGLPDGPPVLPLGLCDPCGGIHAAFATLVGLFQRARDGEGRLVEATMVEAAVNIAVEALVHHDATGDVLGREVPAIVPGEGEDTWFVVEPDMPPTEVIVPRDAIDNPQLQHRRFFETEHHPLTGDHVMATGVPFRMTGVDAWIRFPSPTLGQHTEEVLRAVGYSDDELTMLRIDGVIGEALA